MLSMMAEAQQPPDLVAFHVALKASSQAGKSKPALNLMKACLGRAFCWIIQSFHMACLYFQRSSSHRDLESRKSRMRLRQQHLQADVLMYSAAISACEEGMLGPKVASGTVVKPVGLGQNSREHEGLQAFESQTLGHTGHMLPNLGWSGAAGVSLKQAHAGCGPCVS